MRHASHSPSKLWLIKIAMILFTTRTRTRIRVRVRIRNRNKRSTRRDDLIRTARRWHSNSKQTGTKLVHSNGPRGLRLLGPSRHNFFASFESTSTESFHTAIYTSACSVESSLRFRESAQSVLSSNLLRGNLNKYLTIHTELSLSTESIYNQKDPTHQHTN